MKINVVHVDIVSEEKDFMGLVSWRQFAYCAIGGIIFYNIAKPLLMQDFSIEFLVILIMSILTPLTLIVWSLGFLYLEEPDMYFDRWLVYWLLGKKENNLYIYQEDEVND
ncbi:PrgI family protein [Brevibacillus sp. AG]|uniref:PrgI family mobile element protein n=1 Tax=Brevibacillus sp. AG TaxID=3020891 RepID=UPI00232D43B1|nr:PrgI family protein [Brevibacillus sp. AG]MDC0764170.1 PrgI family protein [Brevibacillus sp. AG]